MFYCLIVTLINEIALNHFIMLLKKQSVVLDFMRIAYKTRVDGFKREKSESFKDFFVIGSWRLSFETNISITIS